MNHADQLINDRLIELSPRIMQLAHRIYGRFSFGYAAEDLAQVALHSISQALAKDPSMDINLLIRIASCDMVDEKRKQERWSNRGISLVSCDTTATDNDPLIAMLQAKGKTPAEVCDESDWNKLFFDRASTILSPRVTGWLRSIADGATKSEISRMEQCSVANVCIRLRKARTIFRQNQPTHKEGPANESKSPRRSQPLTLQEANGLALSCPG